MTDDPMERVTEALQKAATDLLGSQLDGPFSVIRYPPGFNYFVQYSQPALYNPLTLTLIDQMCTTGANGVVSLTGSSFSGKFVDILKNLFYKQSTADVKTFDQLTAQFEAQCTGVIRAFESTFGKISDAQITASGCFPANKIGYIEYVIKTKFEGHPTKIPAAYATFSSAYLEWLSLGERLNGIASSQLSARNQLDAAIANATAPSSANGGWQTGTSTWGIAFTGLPSVSAITGSLTSTDRQMTVDLELKKNSPKTFSLSLAGETAGTITTSMLQLTAADAQTDKAVSISNLWNAASKIDVSISYCGVTLVHADPLELSTDLATGWFSHSILAEIAQKTGHDVTGLQLDGSKFSVSDLFGSAKSFARIKTFVISQEPTVTLTFHGSNAAALQCNLEPQSGVQLQLQLGGVLSFGSTTSGFQVRDISTVNDTTIVKLGPPNNPGTIPDMQRTAHIIGGVVDYPPSNLGAAMTTPGAVTVKNRGAFVAAFSLNYSQNGARRSTESGDLPALVTKTLQLPPDATDILVTIKIATFIKTWSEVYSHRADRPMTKSFELSGTTINPSCKEY